MRAAPNSLPSLPQGVRLDACPFSSSQNDEEGREKLLRKQQQEELLDGMQWGVNKFVCVMGGGQNVRV